MSSPTSSTAGSRGSVDGMAVGEHEVTAASLSAAYESGYRARLNGRPRRPVLDDPDEAFAWLAGWAAADEKIWDSWRG